MFFLRSLRKNLRRRPMEYPDNANKRDVHLRFKRPQGAGWEQLPSTNHFVLSQRIQPFSNGTIYVQGILLDSRGKELSLQQVASLIDAKGGSEERRVG